MPTYEQLMGAARQADAAGDEYAARRFLTLAKEARGGAGAAPAVVPSPEPQGLPTAPVEAPAPQDFRGEGGGRGSALEAALIGARQGVTFGFGDEINAGARAIGDWLGGRGFGEAYDERLAHERGLLAQVRDENPVSSLGGEVGGAVLPALLTGGGTLPMSVGRGAATAAASSAAYGFGEGEGGLRERAKGAAVSGVVGGALGGATTALAKAISGRAQRLAAARAVPGVDDLKSQASALYRQAEQNGLTASQQQTHGLAQTMTGIAAQEGLVSPTGRVSTAYPKVADALLMVEDYAQGQMTPTQMQQVRKTMQKAAQSTDGSEARVGTMMLRDFDGFTSQLAPEFAQANEIYSRAMKGSMIERTIELAGNKAGAFTGSGYENALRSEFRALERKIIKGQIKGLSDAEKSGIKRIAQGGAVENVLRDLGKMAPRGVVSGGLSAGVPFMVGNAVGGPGLGMAAGGAALGVGEVSRRAATAMQSRNAEIARALALTGGKLPQGQMSPTTRAVLDALLAGQAPVADQAN